MTVLRVFRWSSGGPDRWQDYSIDAGPTTTVLDALVAVQQRQDPTLAFRYACRVGMCGSCAMVVNGRERWACRTRLATLAVERVTVRPLYHFPLLRDLAVDMAPFVDRMRAAGAFLPRADAERHTRIAGDSRERRQADAAIECIGCGMCLSACTIVGHHARFPGPAALNRAFTLDVDSRDDGGDARWSALLSDDALARCHGQGNCTEVCPMSLEPSRSIARLRRRALGRLLRPLVGVAALAVALALPLAARAQSTTPHVYLVPTPYGAVAPWALPATPPAEERRATIVAALPEPHRYRVCNDSNTLAALALDSHPHLVELPGRACVDVGARTITIVQRVTGIPARGTYQRLD